SKSVRHLVVVGKAADDLGVQCGGWTITWQGKSGAVTSGGTTILSAVKQNVAPGTGGTDSPDGSNLSRAGGGVVVVGEQPYAEMKGNRTDLRLDPEDVAIVQRAKKSGARVITVLLSGRPLVLGDALEASDAFVVAWLPGTEGLGVGDVLFGAAKP